MPKSSLKIVGIIGDPIAHSRSPAMHNAAFRRLKLPYLYLPFRVTPLELGRFVRSAKGWGLVGFNVTVPHKEAILRFLDGLSPEARAIGAVNTVVRKKGRWIGFNTDGIGYLRSLKAEARFSPRGRSITILGAGGAARAIAYSLLGAGARRLVIANRTVSRARRLQRDLARRFPGRSIEVVGLGSRGLSLVLAGTDLLINATSVGWHRSRFRNFPLKDLPRGALVSDLVYESSTPLLTQARRRGLKVHPGLGMLRHQGEESFRLWTGRRTLLKVSEKV